VVIGLKIAYEGNQEMPNGNHSIYEMNAMGAIKLASPIYRQPAGYQRGSPP